VKNNLVKNLPFFSLCS